MPTIAEHQDALLYTLEQGRRDPVILINSLLPDQTPEPWQEITMRSVWNNPRTAVVCCNGAGKTHVAAQTALAFMMCFQPCIIVTTAGSWNQVKLQLWKEMRSQYHRLPPAYQLGRMHTTVWNISDDWYAVGFSTNKPGLFEGFHAPHVLIILDEAKSIPGDIFDGANRIFSGKTKVARCLQLSTPGVPSGRHFDAFHEHAHRWAGISVNRYEATYTFNGQTYRIPPTEHVTEEFAKDMLEEYGPDNPVYRSMILGQWTQEDSYRLFSVDLINSMKRTPPDNLIDPVHWMGADVARSLDGDESVLYHVVDYHNSDGDIVSVWMEHEEFHTRDASVYRERLKRAANVWGVPRRNINIDGVGIGGPVCDELRREGWPVNEIISGASSERKSPRLANVRSEIWWDVSEKARKGLIYGLTDHRTIAQLSDPRFYYNKRDEIQVEPKDMTRSRLVRERASSPWHSPDRADGGLLGQHRPRGRRVAAYKIMGL